MNVIKIHLVHWCPSREEIALPRLARLRCVSNSTNVVDTKNVLSAALSSREISDGQ